MKQYKNATGEIVAVGELDFTAGLATGTYSGTICKGDGEGDAS